MEGSFQNTSVNVTGVKAALCGHEVAILITMTNVFTAVLGQPITVALLWISLTSCSGPDLLNCNLAIFHNTLCWLCFLHVLAIHFSLNAEKVFLKFIFMYVQIGSPMSLMYICVQRYVAVVHPTSYTLLKKYRYSELSSASVWIITVPSAFFFSFWETPFTRFMFTSIPCILMVLMTVLMVRSSILIARRLLSSGREKLHSAKRKAFMAMRTMTSIALFFYVPVIVIQKLLGGDQWIYDCFATPCCLFLLCVASVVHPLFYLSTQTTLCSRWSKKIRRAEKT